jgi:hypothetical protein
MIPQRKIGSFEVSAVGMGCMPLSDMPPKSPSMLDDREGAISVIHAALDFGVTLLDTADIYAPSWNTMGHNESLVAEAVRTWSGTHAQKAKLVLATKAGITRDKLEGNWFGLSGRNADKHYLFRAVEASALRLGVVQIDIWQHHRLHHEIPYETQFENVLALKDHGYVKHIAVSNVNAEQLRRAIKIGGTPAAGGVVSVQNEYSPRYRNSADVIDICNQYGIAYLPWSPLGGINKGSKDLSTDRFGSFKKVAEAKGVSPFALTIAWHLANFPTSIPIPSSTRRENILETLAGIHIEITADELAELNSNLPETSPIDEELIDQPPFRG